MAPADVAADQNIVPIMALCPILLKMRSLWKAVVVLARALAFVLGAMALAARWWRLGRRGRSAARMSPPTSRRSGWLARWSALVCAGLPPVGWTARALAAWACWGRWRRISGSPRSSPGRSSLGSSRRGADPAPDPVNAWDLSPDPAAAPPGSPPASDVVTVEELTPAFQTALGAHGCC